MTHNISAIGGVHCVIFPDLVDEYQQYQDATADDDEDDEEEDYEQDGDY